MGEVLYLFVLFVKFYCLTELNVELMSVLYVYIICRGSENPHVFCDPHTIPLRVVPTHDGPSPSIRIRGRSFHSHFIW